MLKIFQNEERSLGYIYFLFSSEGYGFELKTFESESLKLRHLQTIRSEVLLINLEIFVNEVKDVKTSSQENAKKRTLDYIRWSNENRDNTKLIFTYFLKTIDSMCNDIVNSFDINERERIYVMSLMLRQLAKEGLENEQNV